MAPASSVPASPRAMISPLSTHVASGWRDLGVVVGAGGAAADVGRGGGAGARRHVGRGRGGRRRDLVARRARDGGRARAAGRRELRQRLLRRRARHRQGPQGTGAPHRDRSRDARRGEARRVPRVRRGRGRGPGALARRRTRGCCSSASPPSPPPWLYTGGPKPYGYLGLGEIMVLVFFGFVATVGSAYVQVEVRAGRGVVGLARRRAARVRDPRSPTTCATSRPTRVTGKRTLAVRVGATAPRGGCSSPATSARSSPSSRSASRSRGRCSACSRCRSRSRRCAPILTRARSAVAGRGARRDVEARTRGRGAGERRAVPVLSEHRLRIGDRVVTLLEGPAGWGECSPLAGLPVRPAAVPGRRPRRPRATASRPRCATPFPVNALVDGPFSVAGDPRATRR